MPCTFLLHMCQGGITVWLMICLVTDSLQAPQMSPRPAPLPLAAVHYMQVVMGFPEPWAVSCLPRLKLVMNGIARTRASSDQTHGRPRLPITTDVLWKLFDVLSAHT